MSACKSRSGSASRHSAISKTASAPAALDQKFTTPLKEFFVRQHTDATRTSRFVRCRNLDRIEFFANDAFRRTRLFDFCNQTDFAGRLQSCQKIANGLGTLGSFLDILQRCSTFGFCDLDQFVIDNLLEDRVHGDSKLEHEKHHANPSPNRNVVVSAPEIRCIDDWEPPLATESRPSSRT